MEGFTMNVDADTASHATTSTVGSSSAHASEKATEGTQNTTANEATSTVDKFTPNDLATWQWLFTPEDMSETPSVLYSGLTVEQERFSRWKGVQLIFRIGDYMRLGNHVTCTASIFLQRFYMRRAMPKDSRNRNASGVSSAREIFTFQEMAPTCIFLACKVEETHRKLHGIIESTMAVLDRTPDGIKRAEAHIYRADISSRDYLRWKDVVLLHEERLLETLCFDLIIDQPHPIAIKGCQRIGVSRDLAQLTILIINILLYGAVCTYYDAATLAAGAFLKACQYTDQDPNVFLQGTSYQGRTWNEAFDVDDDEIQDALAVIDDQLAYHQERIAPPPPVSAIQSTASTPMPGQHVSTTAVRTPSHLANTSVTGTSPLTLTPAHDSRRRRADDEDASSNSDAKRAVEKPQSDAPFSSDGDKVVSAAVIDTPMYLDDKDAVQRETRTDSFRPVSRHGSREHLGGPIAAPLGRLSHDANAAAAAIVAPAGATEIEAAKNEGSRAVAASNDHSEEVAALKVHSEQMDLEKHEEEREEAAASVANVPAVEHIKTSSDDGSEEEGAL